MDEAKVRELGDGRIFTGTQAKANGLVDEVGNVITVIDYAKQQLNLSNVSVVEYEKGPLGGILGNILSNISFLNTTSSLLKQNDVNSKLMHLWVP
jgi:protease-4